jgi:hypothetical protein
MKQFLATMRAGVVLWHGQLERAICALEKIIVDMDKLRRQGDLSAARLNSLGQQLLTYIRLVPLGRSSHAAGQSGDGDRQSTTTAPAQARPAYAAPPPDLSTNPAFAQSRIKPRSFCRSPYRGRFDGFHALLAS